MEKSSSYKICIIIPCYNEEENIEPLYKSLMDTLKQIPDYEILFIDDGSTDGTLNSIKELQLKNRKIKYLSFSKNFGHQNSLKAGFDHAQSDCVISMDADLQHPAELIIKMINLWQENYDIVYTIREDDHISSRLKRKMSTWFYRILNFLSDTKVEFGTADFRLLDRKVIDVLKNNLNEYFLFYRGLLPWIGFTQIGIRYKAKPRFAGKSKYTCAKMFHFATSGITSFTIRPLRFAIYCGFVVSMIAFVYGSWAVYQNLIFHQTLPGWTSLLVSVLFLGGIQILFIGVLGEYLGKMFFEIKKRPHYIIKEKSL